MNQKHPCVLSDGFIRKALLGQSGKYRHYFGGLNDLETLDYLNGERPLHRVLTLDLSDPDLDFSINGVTQIPLLYGFAFDGCELEYEVLSDSTIRIIELVPNHPAEDWPYPNYPAHFEPVPVGFTKPEPANEEKIDEVTWRLFDKSKPSEIWVNVPPNDALGVSLWGSDGDAEGVEVVFRIDPTTRTVSVKNECS